jgi:hypothetical protein
MCLVLGAVVSPEVGSAQTATPRLTTAAPLPVESMASVVIGAIFRLEPTQPILAESGASTDRCAPQTCYRGTVILRSNSRWQLQVRLEAAAGILAPIAWLPVDGPELTVTGAWQAIGTGIQPTNGQSVALRFGAGGAVPQRPDALLLSNALQFRVIPLP